MIKELICDEVMKHSNFFLPAGIYSNRTVTHTSIGGGRLPEKVMYLSSTNYQVR